MGSHLCHKYSNTENKVGIVKKKVVSEKKKLALKIFFGIVEKVVLIL